MQARVSFRLGAVFGLIVFISVIISYLALGRQLREVLYASIGAELRRELALNREMLDDASLRARVEADPDLWADRTGAILDLRVTLISVDGRVIGDSYIDRDKLSRIQNHADRPEVQGALSSSFGEHARYSSTIKEQMLYMAVPVGSPRPFAVLRFAKPLYDIRAFEAGIKKEMERGLFFALLFSLGVVVLTAFFIARPLRRIAEMAERRMHGDFSGSIPAHRRDEIGMLARACNFMSEEVRKMRRSEEWYRAVFSGIREAIVVTDAAGDIILLNPAASRMFRLSGAMFQSRPLSMLEDPGLRGMMERVHRERTAVVKSEMVVTTVKGERTMQVSSMPVIRDGGFDGSVFVLNDITRLRNLERIRRDFVSSVSHELRTPLTSIRGYAETLLDGALGDPENAQAFLRIILQESEQLTALVNDVLDLSRIESGRIEYSFAPVDLGRVVGQSMEVLGPAIAKKAVKLDVSIPPGLPLIHADEAYLGIVVRNLLDNAVKYVDAGSGRIRFSAFRTGDSVQFDVEDNGCGIPQQDLGRIFERFYRVDKARSRELGGTGLGLSIVKHIVLAHRGDIRVRSRLNRGTTFSVTLPMATDFSNGKT
ncbi:ATP-binding protein [Chlorobium sp. N1]|uniref:HAMP domain-containing sensor histidine kinase n=1 Tax=Chlorobium sp. N1 TaxID=2491138 RepID=UPI00103F6223|nr:ATP-binding protein [Chlorobium sp. N1]TCD47356.1 HAMP domain-containing histidine kinase [Chlorobium sp. N1]